MRARRRVQSFLALLPFAACVLWYLPTLDGAFLSDDYSVLGALAGWARDGHLLWALVAKFHSGLDAPANYYRPLSMLSFGVNYALGGADPLGWRLVNLGVHLANGALLFAIARGFADSRASRSILGPALAATLFLFFPTNPEVVAWVSGRYDALALLFMLATLACFQRAAHWHDRWGLAALVAACCAFASKESAALLPALVLAIALTRERASADVGRLQSLWRAAVAAMPWLLLGVAYFGLRIAIFGSAFRVYPGTAPVSALIGGDWLQTLKSAGTWVDAALPAPLLRRAFLVAIAGQLAIGAAWCIARPQLRRHWLAIAVCALLSVILVLPHVAAFAPNGEQGRLFYVTSALLALLAALPFAAAGGTAPTPATLASRAALFAATALCVGVELALLRSTIEPWVQAGAQARALLRNLAAVARQVPVSGYGFVLVPDHLRNVPFGRSAQGGLISPPAQDTPLSSRLIVQTPEDLPPWPEHVRRGLVDALRRYPLIEVWPAVTSGRVTGSAAPTHYFCWDAERAEIVSIRMPAEMAERDWLAAWRQALAESSCRGLAAEIPEH